eukprot:4469522-Pleurochrysis_carterae.AAC.8
MVVLFVRLQFGENVADRREGRHELACGVRHCDLDVQECANVLTDAANDVVSFSDMTSSENR